MTQPLDPFQASDDWVVGVEGSVALIGVSVAREIDPMISDPVIGFVFGEQRRPDAPFSEGAKITNVGKS